LQPPTQGKENEEKEREGKRFDKREFFELLKRNKNKQQCGAICEYGIKSTS